MPISANSQLALELTNLFPAREIAGQAYHRILGFARDLARSGSDLVVEEDLAATFGRGQIDKEVERQFKTDILRDTQIHPLYRNSEVCLDTRPGPTINRAVTDPDRYYMSTIVQLSLLGWVHARMGLASTLADCMNKRYDMELPGARPNPGYQGIVGLLEACSSQTSNFNWNHYIKSVEDRLCPEGLFLDMDSNEGDWLLCLRPETLLAAMDYLYIIQKFPEERRMIISNCQGICTVVVWAYHILNLTVLVKGAPAGDVIFGKETLSPQVIILWKAAQEPEGHGICLLDKNSEIVLQTEQDELTFNHLEACERLPLQNYGTTVLHRYLNKFVSTYSSEPVYVDTAQMVVAMAVVGSRNLVRDSREDGGRAKGPPLPVARWRIITVADMFFKDLGLNVKAIDGFVDAILKDKKAGDWKYLPRSLELHLEKLGSPGNACKLFPRLASLIVVLSNISGIEHGATLPLNSDIRQFDIDVFHNERWHTGLREFSFLNTISGMLMGNRSFHLGSEHGCIHERAFLVSDFGWSVYLSSVGDTDPGVVEPGLLFVRKGVPTKLRTGERRSMIIDADRDLFASSAVNMTPERSIVDKGRTYEPRSIYHIDHRTEYYGVMKDEFQLNIRFSGRENRSTRDMTPSVQDGLESKDIGRAGIEESIAGPASIQFRLPDSGETSLRFTYNTSYRHLHRSLWNMVYSPACSHVTERPHGPETHARQAQLGMGAATATIFNWVDEPCGKHCRRPITAERICVLLVKGDRRARWLAVANAGACESRRTMLCTNECCEDCAFDAVSEKEGKWLLII